MHSITVIVSTRRVLERLAGRFRHAHVRDLEQGFALVPLSTDLYEEWTGDLHFRIADPDASFPALDRVIVDELVELSRHGKVAYVETGYFGGDGSQNAIGWEDGETFCGPRHQGSERPINHVLRLMGVEKRDHADEFEAIGLARFRSTDDWVNAGTTDD